MLTQCGEGTTDLHILDIRTEFENCTIEGNVGYNEETITSFSRLLNSINSRLPSHTSVHGRRAYRQAALEHISP